MPMKNTKENQSGLLKRLYIYQKERFPLAGHGVLVTAFSFSAISYSRICRGAEGFVDWKTFLAGIFTTISLFLLLRIFDEHKDAEDDAQFRKHLPVPRGLVSLRELRNIAIIIVIFQILINWYFFPKMLVLYFVAMAYLLLMGKEFFVASWLKKHQFWYVVSHMLIIPLIDIYASGLDWMLENVSPPAGLLFFFAVSFMSGIVLEIGRKIRPKEYESEGVQTYTSMLGINKAIGLWISTLTLSLLLSIAAAHFAGFGLLAVFILGGVYLLCLLPPILFLRNQTLKNSKLVEYSSAFWAIVMYLSLGGIPMLQNLLFN